MWKCGKLGSADVEMRRCEKFGAADVEMWEVDGCRYGHVEIWNLKADPTTTQQPSSASRKRIWVKRGSPAGVACIHIYIYICRYIDIIYVYVHIYIYVCVCIYMYICKLCYATPYYMIWSGA